MRLGFRRYWGGKCVEAGGEAEELEPALELEEGEEDTLLTSLVEDTEPLEATGATAEVATSHMLIFT